MTPSDRELLLQQYFDGMLSETERAQFEAQLSDVERQTMRSWENQRAALKRWAHEHQRDGHELDFGDLEKRVKRDAALGAAPSFVSMHRSKVLFAWGSAALVLLAVGVGWRAFTTMPQEELDDDAVDTMVSAQTDQAPDQINEPVLEVETLDIEPPLTEVRHVDFGGRQGVVYQVVLDSGATVPVIWVNDDVEID